MMRRRIADIYRNLCTGAIVVNICLYIFAFNSNLYELEVLSIANTMLLSFVLLVPKYSIK